MGRNGVFSSAAAGVSLIAASLVLIVGVSALIGFRGFRSARQAPVEHRVVLQAPATERETGSAAPVVIGGNRAARSERRRVRRARRVTLRARPAGRATRVKRAPARSGLSAPTPQPSKTKAPEPAKPAPGAEPTPAPETPAATPDPVAEVVDKVTGTVEDPGQSVGDVLLDLRDVLP